MITLLHHNLSSITSFYLASKNACLAQCAITVYCDVRHCDADSTVTVSKQKLLWKEAINALRFSDLT